MEDRKENLFEQEVFSLQLKVIPQGSFVDQETGKQIDYKRSIKLQIENKVLKITALQALGLRDMLSQAAFYDSILPWLQEEKRDKELETAIMKKV